MLFVSVATIVGTIYSMLLNIITFPILVLLIKRNYKDEKSLSPHFVINLCTYLIGILACTPYCLYVLIFWRGDESKYSMLIMFWTGTIFYAHASALSTSVFFLIWDRCMSLICPIYYTQKRRRFLCMVNICTQFINYFVILIWEVMDGGMPSSEIYSSCMSYGCASSTTAYKITYMKVFYASLNACSAAIFLIVFLRYNRLRHKSKKSGFNANYLAAFTLCMELVFSCLPNGISYVAWLIDEILLSPMLGPYLAYVFATEVFVVTCVYAKVIGLRQKRILSIKNMTSTIIFLSPKPLKVVPKQFLY